MGEWVNEWVSERGPGRVWSVEESRAGRGRSWAGMCSVFIVYSGWRALGGRWVGLRGWSAC